MFPIEDNLFINVSIRKNQIILLFTVKNYSKLQPVLHVLSRLVKSILILISIDSSHKKHITLLASNEFYI